jgi:hypothetical protein
MEIKKLCILLKRVAAMPDEATAKAINMSV